MRSFLFVLLFIFVGSTTFASSRMLWCGAKKDANGAYAQLLAEVDSDAVLKNAEVVMNGKQMKTVPVLKADPNYHPTKYQNSSRFDAGIYQLIIANNFSSRNGTFGAILVNRDNEHGWGYNFHLSCVNR